MYFFLATKLNQCTFTCVAHELARNLLVTASAAEDLTAQTAVVAASEGRKLLIAVVALFALTVRHPVLLEVTVLKAQPHRIKLSDFLFEL